MSEQKTDTSEGWALFGSIGAAIGAALCCLGPVVLVSLGVTGAWIGELSALEPYRPFFMVLAAGLLGLAFYRVYRSAGRAEERAESCAADESCEVPAADRTNRVVLWIAVVVVFGLFASPYFLSPTGTRTGASARAPSTAADSSEKTTATTKAELEVEGMTCGGCTRTVTSAIEGVKGVREARVTLEPPRATVEFDPSEATLREITESTARVGFESTPIN